MHLDTSINIFIYRDNGGLKVVYTVRGDLNRGSGKTMVES